MMLLDTWIRDENRSRQIGRIMLAPAQLVLPSTQVHADVAKLAVIGAIVAAFFLFAGAFWTPSSWSFLAFAHAIVHGTTLPPLFSQRDLGFPLLALLSGYTVTGSIIPLTAIQALFAVMIPIFVYLPISYYSKAAGFYASLLTIFSLTPYLFMKMIHHDETYMFFMMLMIAMLLRYIQRARLSKLYFFTFSAIAASLTRPAGNLLLPIFLLVSYIHEKRRIWHYAICAIVLIVSMMAYHSLRYRFFDLKRGEPLPSYTGMQIFYGLYINSAEFGITLSSELGPNIARIADSVRRFTSPDPSVVPLLHNNVNFPEGSVFVKKRIDALSPLELSQQVLSVPCYQYHVLMQHAEPDDHVFMGAAWEIAKAHPVYVLGYTLRNFLVFLFRPGYAHPVESPDGNCGPLRRIGMLFYPDFSRIYGNTRDIYVDPVMDKEVENIPPLRPRIVKALYSTSKKTWLAYYNRLVDLASFFMVAAWAIAVLALGAKFSRSPPLVRIADTIKADTWVPCVISATALLFYNGLVTAAFAEPDYRYSEMVFPVNALIAGLGAAGLLRLCGVRAGRFGPAPGTVESSRSVWITCALVSFIVVGVVIGWSIYTIVKTHD